MRAYLTFSQGHLDDAATPFNKGAINALFADKSNNLGPDVLGGKGHNLARMVAEGYPVPPGFVITTPVCRMYQKNPEATMEAIAADLDQYIDFLKIATGLKHPIVSVRSGAPVSMPGMMDTVLNVGLTQQNTPFWVQRLGERTTWDCRRRFYHMYADIVAGVSKDSLYLAEQSGLKAAKVETVSEMAPSHLYGLCQRFKNLIAKAGDPAPETLKDQLLSCIAAVFRSWNTPRAIHYRDLNGISHEMGTAVVVQAMVFGNLNQDSATGVLFTRDPSTGERAVKGEFLINAQGEDVVAGTVTPRKFVGGNGMAHPDEGDHLPPLSEPLLKAFDALVLAANRLDASRGDMQDIEFTIEDGKLWLLQTRTGKRSAAAAFAIALDQYNAGVWGLPDLRHRLSASAYSLATRPSLNVPETEKTCGLFTSGIVGSTGVAIGRAAFTEAQADQFIAEGHPVVYIAKETTPDDISVMAKAVGIMTSTGGFTSHAAVVARGMDKVCITGCTGLQMSTVAASTPKMSITPGDWVTLNGATGTVYKGKGVEQPGSARAADAIIRILADDAGIVLRDTTPVKGAWFPAVSVAATLCKDAFTKLLAETTDSDRSTLILDLSPVSMSQPDAIFMQALGLSTSTVLPHEVLLMVYAAAQTTMGMQPFRVYTADPDIQDKGGWMTVVRGVSTIQAALAAEQAEVILSEAVLAALGGADAEQIIRDALHAQGKRVVTPGISLSQAAALLLA